MNLERIAALFGDSCKFPKLFPEKTFYLFWVVKKYLALYWLSIRILKRERKGSTDKWRGPTFCGMQALFKRADRVCPYRGLGYD